MGFVPGVTLTKWRRIWAERLPRQQLEVLGVSVADQRSALEHGLVDLCFIRLPEAPGGLHVIRLYDEVPVVVVPKDHPVAAFDEVSLADLADEKVLVHAESADAFDRVAWGAGVLCVPQSIARSHSRRDLAYRPITDAEPTTIGLAWLVDNPHDLIEEFVGIVRGRTANSSRGPRAGSPPPVEPPARPTTKGSDASRRSGRTRPAHRRERGR